ncbi:uncharacterized protein LOC125889068 [Epinephelus fuscoguttatus]|uniref:uncharacterized protein LOC125889068 n=1 Tax=Epinephelus fuscoguttatus TaxID=293821 RepID=UPI0020D02399|nr:uncharacterized protein LOC125889068 [Epinephelus fuscoguttatus]
MLDCEGMESHGLRNIPPVEPVVAAHLHPKASLSSLGPALPSRADRFQSSLTDKAYKAAALSARALNATSLLMAYQAELEEEMTASPDPMLWEEMCVITDHCLHLHKVAIQSQGRAMGLMVLQERARWLIFTTLSAKEKEDLLDTPISPKGLFGAAVTSMQKRCEERKREDKALKLCLRRRAPTATLPAHRQTFAQAVARPPPTFKIPKLPKSQAAPQAPPRAQAPKGPWQKKSSSQEGTLPDRPPPTFTHGSAPLGVDALAHQWPRILLYAFPPIALISPTLARVREEGARGNISSPPREAGPVGLAREWLNLQSGGLPPGVIETIQSARAPSTRSLYESKWSIFEKWCSNTQEIPFQCSVVVILAFLQDMVDKRMAFSTIKVYLAAISACHIGFGGKTVGQHPLVCRFMKGARRKLPVSKPLAPSWDLPMVLDALSAPPFEPLDQVDLKMVALKTVLLLSLASAKRVGEIHALSVHEECTKFSAGNTRVTLQPNPAFMPKVLGSCSPIDLVSFYPPPFSSDEHRRLHMLCPVRALRIYMDRTEGCRKSDQLFVSWAKNQVGKPVSKQRLSHWIVGAIALAYSAKGAQAPEGLRAHSTRGLSTSWALFRGVPIQEICAAASWASPHTFIRFYKLDVTASSLAHSVLGLAKP